MKQFLISILAGACMMGMAAGQQSAGDAGANANAADKPAKYAFYESVEVTPGKYQQFSQATAQIRQTAASSSADAYWIAGSHFTGDARQMVFVTFQPNMAAVEKFDEALGKVSAAAMAKNASLASDEGQSQGHVDIGLAEYKEELSLRPEMVPPGAMRFWQTTSYTLRPGCNNQFEDVVKQVAEMHKNLNDHAHWMAYEVYAGGTVPTYLLVRTMKSLADVDEEPPAAAKQAFEARSFQNMVSGFGKECLAHIERNIYKVEPGLSHPAQAMVAANPEFWNVKDENASMAAPKKGKKGKGKAGTGGR
jgi:hypothetical protein